MRISRCLATLGLLAGPLVANAGLVPVNGGQLVNDTDHNITWTADGNLFLTQATQSGDAAAFVATIISDWGMPFVSSSNYNNGASYSLTAADFDTNGGGMTWFGVVAWINYLNVTNYQGYSDWRFPNIGPAGTIPGICGGACYPSNSGEAISSSEWWELFFPELGGVQGTPISTTHNSNYALFSNIQGGYWSNGLGNDSVNTFADMANGFYNDGGQGRNYTTIIQAAWVVRSGLSVASPPPMAHLVLVPSGLLSFGDQVVGAVSPPQSVKVTSTGTGAATMTIAAAGDFVPTSNCPASLVPGASCTISVTFNPAAVDARTGSLTVNAGVVYSVALSGTGTIDVSVVASASTVTAGVPVTLTWTSSAGAACTASSSGSGDGWSGNLGASGTTSVTETSAGTYTYSLYCSEGSQGAVGQAVVINTVPSVSISANPTNLMYGEATTVTWSSTNADSCNASSNGSGDGWTGTKATSGTAAITESTVGQITYTLTCTSGPQSAKATVQVFNNAKPSSGGGGQMNLLSLLFMLVVFLFRCTAYRQKRPHFGTQNARSRPSWHIGVASFTATFCAAAAFAVVPCAVAQTYRVTNLSSLVSGGLIVGMNNSGEMAGNLPTPGNPLADLGGGFIYSKGSLTLIPGIGGQSSYASAINSLGQVTGNSNNHAFIYSNGVTTDIGALPTVDVPPTDGVAAGTSINDSGQVTGYSITEPNAPAGVPAISSAHAFLYSNGVMTDLGVGAYSSGLGINGAGEIVGGVGPNGAKQPFLYKNGAVTLIGPANSDQEKGNIAFGAAINNAGDIVGALIDGSKTPSLFAFIYSNGTITDLTQLGPGSSYLDQATAINDVGQALVQLNQVPYLYSGGVVKALSSLIDATDPVAGVVALKMGVAIYDDGSMLVTGNPSIFNSTPTSYLLTPLTLIFSPTALAFGGQLIGTVSPKQSVSIKNNAAAPIPIGSVIASGDFVSANNCGASLAPGASCTIDITFAPTAVDARTGTLTVSADFVYVVALTGTGTIGVAVVAGASTVTVGVPVTLTWTSTTGGAACMASGGATGDGWTGQLVASGTKSVTETAAGKYTYVLNCTLGSQSAQGQAVVTDTVPSVSLSANPTNLTLGQPTTLTWTSTNAASCTANSNAPGDGWTGPKATGGASASITETTVGLITYTLTCTSGPQSAQASAAVFDNAKPSSGGGGQMNLLSLLLLLGISGLHTVRTMSHRESDLRIRNRRLRKLIKYK